MASKRNVRAVVVSRPVLDADADQRVCLEVQPPLSPDAQGGAYTLRVGAETAKPSTFTFPAAYGFGAAAADTLCAMEIEPLLRGCMDGESAAVIAYGQTGAGKSFVCGTQACKEQWAGSVGAFLARRIFELHAELGSGGNLKVSCGMVEIYKEGSQREWVYDLLNGPSRCKLDREYSEATYRWREVLDPGDLQEQLAHGAANRNTDRTGGNERSSRSHAIFTVRLQRSGAAPDGRAVLTSGRFMLVDLAGAENASAADAGSVTQRQGAGINVGLSTLQQVIQDVARTGNSAKYRDSKLTFFLKPALGGKGDGGCNAVFLGCVSPLLVHMDRTVKTLDYMQQAGSIQNTVVANVESLEARREDALRQECDSLKALVAQRTMERDAAREALATAGAAPAAAPMPPPPPPTDVVLLTADQHRQLLLAAEEERLKSSHLEGLLREAEARHQEQSAALAAQAANNAALTPAGSLPPGAAFGSETPLGLAPPQFAPHVLGTVSRRATPGPGSISRRPTPVGTSPALAALVASPVLAAARSMLAGDASPLGGGDALGVDEICLAGLEAEECNLEGEQLAALRQHVGHRLQAAEEACAGGSGGDQQLHTALGRRGAEIEALQLAVRAYNECLGDLAGQLAEAQGTVQVAAQEKVKWVQVAAKYEEALTKAQHDLRYVAALLDKERGKAEAPGSLEAARNALNRVGRAMASLGLSERTSDVHKTPGSGAKPAAVAVTASATPGSPAPGASPPPHSPGGLFTALRNRWSSPHGAAPPSPERGGTPAMSAGGASPSFGAVDAIPNFGAVDTGPGPSPSPPNALPSPGNVVDLTIDDAASVDEPPAAANEGESEPADPPPRRRLLQNPVVPTNKREEEQALRQQLNAGVDVSAISAARQQQAEALVASSSHWQPGQPAPRTRSRR